jgi:competence protein ComEA
MNIAEVNTANKETLMKISGIGAKKASALIQERSQGLFKSFEDLERVKGVGKKMISNIKNDVQSKSKKEISTKESKEKTTVITQSAKSPSTNEITKEALKK